MSKNYWRVRSKEEEAETRAAYAKIYKEQQDAERATRCSICNVKKSPEHDKIVQVFPHFTGEKCTRCNKLLMDHADFRKHIMNRRCVIGGYHPFPPRIFRDVDEIKSVFCFGKTEEFGVESPVGLIDETLIRIIMSLALSN